MKPVIYMAPMRGITDAVFRNVFHQFFSGVDLAVSPFICAPRHQKITARHVQDVLPENNTGLPLIPQILTCSATDFIRLATCLDDLGYPVVNWNLGCPFPMVARKGKGSGLLPHTARIDAFLSQVLRAIPGRLSIKLRLGREVADDIYRLIPVLNQYPLEEIILHPRTGVQMYTGVADAEAFGRCRQLIAHQLVYNGDIDCVARFQKLRDQFPDIHRWMLGRGLVANPFLAQCMVSDGPPPPDRLAVMRRFHDALMDGYARQLSGPGHLLGKMKGFWTYWQAANPSRSIKNIQRSQTISQYEAGVALFFNPKTGAR